MFEAIAVVIAIVVITNFVNQASGANARLRRLENERKKY